MEASESLGAVRAARVLRVQTGTHHHRQFFSTFCAEESSSAASVEE
jgi:hypothetical protein